MIFPIKGIVDSISDSLTNEDAKLKPRSSKTSTCDTFDKDRYKDQLEDCAIEGDHIFI